MAKALKRMVWRAWQRVAVGVVRAGRSGGSARSEAEDRRQRDDPRGVNVNAVFRAIIRVRIPVRITVHDVLVPPARRRYRPYGKMSVDLEHELVARTGAAGAPEIRSA